jgi:zinc transport system substrate-binding protein
MERRNNAMKKGLCGAWIILLVMSMFLGGCSPSGSQGESSTNNNHRLTIYTTIYPLYDFTKKLAGDQTNVINLVPPGVEPHDFEPKPQDIMTLNKAQVFVYNGGGFEGWVDKVVQSLDNKNLVVVDTSKFVQTEKTASGQIDPHFWLDPNQAKNQAKAIYDALVKVDPAHKSEYTKRFDQLSKQFADLDSSIRAAVAHTSHKEMIVSHAAFGYLAHAYGLQQIAISGINPSEEPSQQDLSQIVELAKAKHIEYILFETLSSGKIAETVKNEVGARALNLNPVENLTQDDINKGKDYFAVMKENIDTLKIALGSK